MPEVTQESHPWIGKEAFDRDGERVGKVSDVYLDRVSHRPAWVLVRTGRFGGRRTFVPMTGAALTEEGVRLPFSGRQIADAPHPAADGALVPAEEQALYRHYGVETNQLSQASGLQVSSPEVPVLRLPADDQLPSEMIRSEEELHVSTVFRPSERIRIRKVVVTEEATITVTLRREEIRIERIPVTADVGESELQSMVAEAAATETAELVLLYEEPVVEKRLVPYERVRFFKEMLTEERHVTDHVRKERIITDNAPLADQ